MSASEARDGRLVDAALRCYPARWRRRHADEAAELAALLIRDGTPAASIAWSYLVGAAREWLTPPPGRPLSTVAAALLAATCLLGFSAALLAGTAPARAASTTQPPSGPVPPKIKPTPPSAASSSPRQFTPCLPVLPRQVTGAILAAGQLRLSIQGTAHASSC
ncbi:MAG: hypothetical protein JWM19_3174 [Actinomycetia bacterium]|nr:hypothetical protein [Actinomycetes bacterium]